MAISNDKSNFVTFIRMMKYVKIIASIISIIFLFLAFIEGWPYGFFMLLRIVICGTTAYLAWLAYRYKKEFWKWAFGFIAILFNPFFPVHLGRELWLLIDLITAVFLIASLFSYKIPDG